MALETYSNIDEINQTTNEIRVLRYSSQDISLLDNIPICSNFGKDERDVVELHIYDSTNKLIASHHDVKGSLFSDLNSKLENKPSVLLNPEQIMSEFGLGSGTYKLNYNFFRNILGTSNSSSKLIITDISDDRTEIKVTPSNIDDKIFNDNFIHFSKLNTEKYYYWTDFVVNFGLNDTLVVVNFSPTKYKPKHETFPYSLVFKLYSPLSNTHSINDVFWLSIETSDSVVETITFNANEVVEVDERLVLLRPPNFSIDFDNGVGKETGFKNWNDLLGTNVLSSQQLINEYISGSFDNSQLNIDYTEFSDFVHFSSAEERIKNFEYKLELIEFYNDRLNELLVLSGSVSASSTTLSEVSSSITKRDVIISGFDGFEKFMYYESGSIYSSSLGYVYDRTWPKQNDTKPYVLYPTTSSVAELWFATQSYESSVYDRTNQSALVKSIPFHVRNDSDNEKYDLFINMIAQHFDIMWLYIDKITQTYEKENLLSLGISKDMLYHMIESYGWKLDEGNYIDNLWEYKLNKDSAGNYATASYGLDSISPEDRTKEIWKRIWNNLPLLTKEKGTSRSIKALMACYGIPMTVLRIKEYGGSSYSGSFYEIDKYSNVLNFKGTQSLWTDWKDFNSVKPDSLEFRFRTISASLNIPDATYQTQSLVCMESGSDATAWSLLLYQSSSTSEWGKILFSLNSGSTSPKTMETNYLPLFTGDMYGVLLSRESSSASNNINQTFNLYVKRYYQGRTIQEESSSLSINGLTETGFNQSYNISGTLYFGKIDVVNSSSYFSGSFQEIRLWRNQLSESVFDGHVMSPMAYFGNNETSSYHELLTRFPLITDISHFSASAASSSIYDYNPKQEIINYGTASNFPSESYYSSIEEEYHVKTPRYWGNKINSNKIRWEDSELDGNLSSIIRREKITSDTYTSDSNKVGINLSPIDIINEDIFSQMGDFVLDNYIGDPRDQYKNNYKSLDDLKTYYFKKYQIPNNFVQFFRYIKMYDRSLFKQIRRMLPAKSNAIVGTSLESHILERPKYKWKLPSISSQSYQDSVDYDIGTDGEQHSYSTDGIEYITGIDSVVNTVHGSANFTIYDMSSDANNHGLSDEVYLFSANFSSSIYSGLQTYVSHSRQTQSKTRVRQVEYGVFKMSYTYTGSYVQENIPQGLISVSSSNKTRGFVFSTEDVAGNNYSKQLIGLETIPTDSRLIMKLYRIPVEKANKKRGNTVNVYQSSDVSYLYGTTVYLNATASYLSGNENFVDGDTIEIEFIRRKDEISRYQEFDAGVMKSIYKGTSLSKLNSLDGEEPVIVYRSNPNKLIVKSGDSFEGSIKIE